MEISTPEPRPYGCYPLQVPRLGLTVSTIEHSSIDPKTSVLVKVFRDSHPRMREVFDGGRKRRRGGEETGGGTAALGGEGLEDSDRFEGLEVWKLSEVTFLDDSPAVLGRVITIDQQQAIVDISYSQTPSPAAPSITNIAEGRNTLRVFRTADLETCMEIGGERSTDSPLPLPTRAKLKPASAARGSTPLLPLAPPTKAVSHHVAGSVQHWPVCLLDPGPDQRDRSHGTAPPDAPLTSSSSSSPSKIAGFRPLAVHASDEGPTLLLERLSDRRVFLVCSAHASLGAFASTSFVALGSSDGKPVRCTIEAEAANAVDSGLSTGSASQVCVEERRRAFGDDDAGGPQEGVRDDMDSLLHGIAGGLTQDTPHVHVENDTTCVEHKLQTKPSGGRPKSQPSPCPCPSFVSCFNSEVLFLLDVHGLVCPLANGLRLTPAPELKQERPAIQLLQPYKGIVSRQYIIGGGGGSVLVFGLGEL